MTKVKLSCTKCYGVFEVSKSFFKKEDDHPKFCTFCGTETIVIDREYEVPRNGLTDHQRAYLKTFLLMTTQYRKGEIEACEKLAKELDEEGKPKFPNMAANAAWWSEVDDVIEEIIYELQ